MTTIPVGFMNKKQKPDGLNIFYIGGYNSIQDNYPYNISSASWLSALASKPTGTDTFEARRIDNKIICVGGRNNMDLVEVYNIDSDIWDETQPDFPTATVFQTGSCVINEEMYIFDRAGDVYKRNNTDGSWIQCDSQLVDNNTRFGVAEINNKAYLTGGTADKNGVYEFDPSKSSGSQWTKLTDLTVNRSQHCSAGIGNNLYIFSGDGVDIPDVYVYDVTNPSNQNGIVSAYECDLGNIVRNGFPVVYNNEIYIANALVNELWKFNPDSVDKWVNLGANPFNSGGGSVLILDDRV